MQEIFDKANAVLAAINDAKPATPEELEAFRIQYLGSKNVLKDLFGALAQLPGDRKKEYGQLMNTSKNAGQLNVLDGFGTINITNSSNIPVMLSTLKTGDDPTGTGRGTAGVIDIMDITGVDTSNAASPIVSATARMGGEGNTVLWMQCDVGRADVFVALSGLVTTHWGRHSHEGASWR